LRRLPDPVESKVIPPVEYWTTLFDLGAFMDEPAAPITSDDLDTRVRVTEPTSRRHDP
jgi:hypothetical protein